MPTIQKLLLTALGATVMFTACQNSGNNSDTAAADSTAAPVKIPLELADVTGSPDFQDATLNIATIQSDPQGKDSAKVSFAFSVKNYELGNQTADAADKMCNNSDKGQHIHFIMDNKPYVALYEPNHTLVLPKNSEHYLMAFLSRSYHESIKTKGAALVYHFKIDGKGKMQKLDEPKTPMVFYSRPKGDYLGKDTENLLFDYYVWNGNVSDSLQVEAKIKGDDLDTTITMNSWKAQFLKNMPMGKSSIKLSLVGKDGKKLDGPETSVTREFKLAKEEPMK